MGVTERTQLLTRGSTRCRAMHGSAKSGSGQRERQVARPVVSRALFITTLATHTVGCGNLIPTVAPDYYHPTSGVTIAPDYDTPIGGLTGLVLDAAVLQTCAKTLRKFVGLPSANDSTLSGPDAGKGRSAGRWKIETCLARRNGTNFSLEMGGPGWIWADQTQFGFHVRQYVYFNASASMEGPLDLKYDGWSQVASVSMQPSAPPKVVFTPIGAINANPENILAWLLGGVVNAFSSMDSVTKSSAEKTGIERFGAAMAQGFTLTYSLKSGQPDVLMGQLEAGVVPARPYPAVTWVVNERQELHAGGFQITGPFPYAPEARLTIRTETGVPIKYGAACMELAESMTKSLVVGRVPGGVADVTTSTVPAGPTYTSSLAVPQCDWVLVTNSPSESTVALLVQ